MSDAQNGLSPEMQPQFDAEQAALENWFAEGAIASFSKELEAQECSYLYFTEWYEYLMREEDYTPEAAERQAHAYCVQGRKPPTVDSYDENAAPDVVSEVTAIAGETLAIVTVFTDEDDEIPF